MYILNGLMGAPTPFDILDVFIATFYALGGRFMQLLYVMLEGMCPVLSTSKASENVSKLL
jgi:hypothetical protein